MVIRAFPPLESADENGLVAVGGDLDLESLLLAYRSGIFPWPLQENMLLWFSPPRRAILYLEKFHPPKSLRKIKNRGDISFATDRNFAAVITECARVPRQDQPGTWITSEIIAGYLRLHQAGYVHSIECYQGAELVGGLYGVALGGMFAGESMFHRLPNMSKLALWHLVEVLKAQRVEWIDCQTMTPLLQSFGAEEVPRDEFVEMLNKAISFPIRLTF